MRALCIIVLCLVPIVAQAKTAFLIDERVLSPVEKVCVYRVDRIKYQRRMSRDIECPATIEV